MGRNNEKGTKEDLCRYRLEISKADLRSAMLLLEAGELRGANNRASEIFSRELGRKISEAVEIRHASDHDDFYIATREEAEEQIETAKELLCQIETYVQGRL